MNILLFFLTATAFTTHAQECQTVDTVPDFDIDQYASAKWYVHQQMEIEYLPIENNYCATAEYTVFNQPSFPFGYTVGVDNRAQDEDGNAIGGPGLCAYQTNAAPSKLAVGLCILPKTLAGPYWVLEYDEMEGYALISGGQPTILSDPDNGLCKTGTDTNDSGLWIFSRSQYRNETLIEQVRSMALDKGFDLTVLNDVDHTPCVDPAMPAPSNECPVENYLGETFYVYVQDKCLKIELFDGGVLAADLDNTDCANPVHSEDVVVSTYDSAYDNKAVFEEGDLGWSGIFVFTESSEESSNSDATDFEIVVKLLRRESKEFVVELVSPSCL